MEPEPPVNVRIAGRDGTDHPVSCFYVGRVDGVHLWEAIVPPNLDVVRVKADVLPAHTGIRLAWSE